MLCAFQVSWKCVSLGSISNTIITYSHSLGKSGVDHVTVTVVSQHMTLFLFYFYLNPDRLEIPLGVI